jgi:hypothetical protein
MLDAHGKEPTSTFPMKLCCKDSLEEGDLCFSSNQTTLSQSHATLTTLPMAKDSIFGL